MWILLVELTWAALVPGLSVVILGGAAWLFKQVFYEPLKELRGTVPKINDRVIQLQTAMHYYLESRSIDAIAVLDKPNPAPPEIRSLFKKLRSRELAEADRKILAEYLADVSQGRKGGSDERGAALQMLRALQTIEMLPEIPKVSTEVVTA